MLRVSVVDDRGRAIRAPGLARWLARAAPARARGDVTIALVPDARIRKLNRHYRGKDYATDVLSFQADPWPDAPGPKRLGDIVIARAVAARQAREQGHTLAIELKILALHGLLHLLGYDHEVDAGQMSRLERRLRRKGGLKAGDAPAAGARRRGPQRAGLCVGVARRRGARRGRAAERQRVRMRPGEQE